VPCPRRPTFDAAISKQAAAISTFGCNTHQTVALDIVRRPKATPVHELERYMRCKDCSQVRGLSLQAEPSGRAATDENIGE
jgi:hypothetical protein